MKQFFLIVLMLCVISFVSSSNSGEINILEPYTVHIIDWEIANLIVHVQSKDNDLGNHTMTIHDAFHWKFRRNFGETTEFIGNFYWMTLDNQVYQEVDFQVFNNDIADECGNKLSENHCYWFVTTVGFYFAKGSPSGWVLKYTWGN
ncbi:hypothetical protein L2E82_10484 [Cichorium intybus]|uniref:Uncharacterized protein n=1 Tax=Cichorium intybus TaxID=13427 RepID=A0ACB9GAJ7_CICIN|nr:hypothetical protein L2E82_10484 [Cichorium intybus]